MSINNVLMDRFCCVRNPNVIIIEMFHDAINQKKILKDVAPTCLIASDKRQTRVKSSAVKFIVHTNMRKR